MLAGNDNIHDSLDEFDIRPDPTAGFHGNKQGYDGKNGVSTFSRLFFIHSFPYLQVTMTCMRARLSSILGLIGLPTLELAALERLKNPHILILGKNWCCPFFSATLNQKNFILAGNDEIYKSLYEFYIRPDPIMDYRVSCF